MAREKGNGVNRVKDTKTWKVVNYVVIFITMTFLAAIIASDSARDGWYHAYNEITNHPDVVDKADDCYPDYNKVLDEANAEKVAKQKFIEALDFVGVYVFLEVLYYILYLFKNRKTLYIVMLISIMILVTGYFMWFTIFNVLPAAISALIYYRILRLEGN